MKNKKSIAPITMGALTLTMGMSLVNNANATLIAGSGDGATVTTADIYVNANDGGEDWASAFIDLSNGENEGEDGFGIYVDAYTGSGPNYQYDEGYLGASWWNQLQFSVGTCGANTEEGEDFGEDNCLNKLNAGTEINADWFNGTLGNGSSWGILYSDYINSDPQNAYENYIGNWGSIGDTGYVAFAFIKDFNAFDGELEFIDEEIGPIGTNIWQQSNVQYGWLDVTRGSISINNVGIQNLTPTSVPEPGSLLLLGAGLFGLAYRKKR